MSASEQMDRDPQRPEIDFESMAGTFDAVAPLLEPVIDAVLEPLADVHDGMVVDIACGTGEPGLTLARRRSGIHLLGIDNSSAMIDVARAKAGRHSVSNVEFTVAPAEDVPVDDAQARAVISRFGLLAFGDQERSASEATRMLQPGGLLSIAVWPGQGLNPLAFTTLLALRPNLPASMEALFAGQDPMIEHRRRVEVLDRAGLRDTSSKDLAWDHVFPDFESLWQLVSGPAMLAQAFAMVEPSAVDAVRTRLIELVSEHREQDGSYRMPQRCRLYQARLS